MDRRDFLKSALTVAALAPLPRLAAKAGVDGDKSSDLLSGAQVTRRRYKSSGQTLPLLGFGMMRMPRISPGKPDIDYGIAAQMIERAMKAGVNYFDTAYFYHDGLSEKCAGDLLAKYPRDSYYMTSKMPIQAVKRASDLERIWNEQLSRCKVDYFDFYLFHNLNRSNREIAHNLKIYDFLRRKKEEGKIRRLGFSFHDEPEILETIAGEFPWDFAQIQLNYLDWSMYRSREQYEILTKHGIPLTIMEPLRGGMLASLNAEAAGVLKKANPNVSVASWAFRYVASLPNVLCVLSGMSLSEHLEDNIRTFTEFKPLTDSERETIKEALTAYHKCGAIPCTECRYCMPCPAGVEIPRVFGLYNQYKVTGNYFRFHMIYDKMSEDEKAFGCVNCGACLKKCPQQLRIPALLTGIAEEVRQHAGQEIAPDHISNPEKKTSSDKS